MISKNFSKCKEFILDTVDGGNWLRRDFVMPEFTPVSEQLQAALRPEV